MISMSKLEITFARQVVEVLTKNKGEWFTLWRLLKALGVTEDEKSNVKRWLTRMTTAGTITSLTKLGVRYFYLPTAKETDKLDRRFSKTYTYGPEWKLVLERMESYSKNRKPLHTVPGPVDYVEH